MLKKIFTPVSAKSRYRNTVLPISMERDARRTSYQASTLRTPARTRSSAPQPMDISGDSRHMENNFLQNRLGFGRNSLHNQFGASYPDTLYQDQQLGSQTTQSNNSMPVIETHYSTYPHDSGRSYQFPQLASGNNYQQYQSNTLLPPMPPSTMFESITPFHGRQPSVIGSVNSNYSHPSYLQSSSSSAVYTADTSTQYTASQPDATMYESTSSNRPEVDQSFGAAASGFPSLDSITVQTQTEQQKAHQDQIPDLDAYEQQLRSALSTLVSGRINTASNLLQDVTRRLLSSVARLGLQFDDASQYERRMSMWREFNHCWEALAQRQKNVIEQEQRTGTKSTDKLSSQRITQLVNELISMCDQIEEYGLVDYEMGVWEEQIVGAFTVCLELMDRDGRGRGTST